MKRNHAIDFYKFFLSIIILVLHSNYYFCPQGYLGVESFFIISGFYLGMAYQKLHQCSFGKILRDRILPIYLSYLIMVILNLIYELYSGTYIILKSFPVYFFGIFIITNKATAGNFVGLIGYLWYIPVYIQLYVISILCIKKLNRTSTIALAIVTAIVSTMLIIYDSPSLGLNYTIESFHQPIPIGYLRGLIGLSYGYICSNILSIPGDSEPPFRLIDTVIPVNEYRFPL